jgi:Antitoxin VbhA
MSTLIQHGILRNRRSVSHAIAQQELEGLRVSKATIDDMSRAARGEIPADEVIRNIYARFKHVPIFRPRPLS